MVGNHGYGCLGDAIFADLVASEDEMGTPVSKQKGAYGSPLPTNLTPNLEGQGALIYHFLPKNQVASDNMTVDRISQRTSTLIGVLRIVSNIKADNAATEDLHKALN